MSPPARDWTRTDLARIEARTQELGRHLFEHLPVRRPMPWQRRWWDEQLMQWAMADETVKVQMFRFVDVLPMLRSSRSVVEHLQEYFRDVQDRLPPPARFGLESISPDSLAGRTLARAARAGAQNQARRFIAGSTVDEVVVAAFNQRKKRWAFTLDILGEAVTSEAEAQRYHEAYLELIEGIAPTANRWPEVPQIDRDADGSAVPRTNISIKLSALDHRFDEIDPPGATRRVGGRLRELLRSAQQQRAFINVDMEAYHSKDLTLHIFKSVLDEEEFRDFTDVGIVIQCYLKDAHRDLVELRDWARRRGRPVWVRLVKGAYWDYETTVARARRWPVPVFEQKGQTDANFEQQVRFLLANSDILRPAVASHNIRSLAYSVATAEALGLPPSGFEVQMLYGMADAEKEVLVDLGHRLRVYMPYGELIPGMAYLVRRLLENTSNDSFLRAAEVEHVAPEALLMNPLEHKTASDGRQPACESEPQAEEKPFWQTYRNEPPTDFADAANREAMQAAIEQVREGLGRHWPLWIDQRQVDTESRLQSRNPSNTTQVVGTTAMATAEHVDEAVAAASGALAGWSGMGAERRAEYIRGAAAEMRRRRFELAAWQVFECGKPWREADADVAEAIDFCEYYAAGAIAMDRPSGVNVPGEENRFTFLPRGVAAVIAPWNFPLAILTGMTTAALATGNTVIMKPAEQSSVIGALLMQIFRDLDLPPGVLQYLPGVGDQIGAALVDHPQVALIAFTGSREVGLAINRRAAELSQTGLPHVKKVIAEMGGKNAIIVDSDADLDEAVLGVVHSAFGYEGQKCSACSRAIVLDEVYDQFVGRLVEAVRSLQVGPADDPAAQVGPLIDEQSVEKVRRYIDIGREEGEVALAVETGELARQGHFVGPHIFTGVAPDARIAQEEIFGPVLAVIGAKDLDEAIRIANTTAYGLTAGFYSRSPERLQRAARELQVGNVYLNRGCTGAIVGRQPFGGFKMSGIGSKAGGPDYLFQFVLPKTVTENTMRRGFAPPPD